MQPSCYLLEFSVGTGGARLGDVYAGPALDAVRTTVRERWAEDDLGPYLIISYGALLRLWVVQEGAIVEGIDLHPFLRTGDERHDRTLARVFELRREDGDRYEEIGDILDPYEFDAMAALPLLTRLIDLQDRLAANTADAEARAELDGMLAAALDGEAPPPDETISGLHLDWAALAEVAPPLREPLLTSRQVGVRWADPAMRPRASYLYAFGEPGERQSLDLGLNALEG